MNILIISHMYPSTFNSMSGVFIHKQIKELVSLGCKVTVVSPIPWSGFPINIINSKWKKYSQIPFEYKLDNIEVYYPRYFEFPKGYFFKNSGKRMYIGIKNTIYKLNNKYKFDLIHSHVALPDGYCGMLINNNLKIPHIVTIHGQDFQYTINKNDKLKETVFEVLKNVDKIIVVSSKLKRIVQNTEFYNKLHIINNGIDINDNVKEGIAISDIPDDIDILSVSNLIKTKGIDLNIKAVKKLSKKYPYLKYYIIGDGPERLNLECMVKQYGLVDNVIFLGKLEHHNVIKYMNKCKIFSLPSWQEGFGVVYVEAMLQGKPVIGVKGEGIEDVIIHNENGFLIKPKDVEDIVKIIDLLMENQNIINFIGENAKKTVIENFTWENSAKKIVKLYKEILNKQK